MLAIDEMTEEERLNKALRHLHDSINLLTTRASDIDSINYSNYNISHH